MAWIKTMTDLIVRRLGRKQGFILEVRGKVYFDVANFINDIWLFGTECPNICVVENDIRQILCPTRDSSYINDWYRKYSLIISSSPWEAINRLDLVEHEAIIIIIHTETRDEKWYELVDQILKIERAKKQLNVIFFSDSNDISILKSITIDASFAWSKKESRFVHLPKDSLLGKYYGNDSGKIGYLTIDQLIEDFKEDLDEVKLLVDGMVK